MIWYHVIDRFLSVYLSFLFKIGKVTAKNLTQCKFVVHWSPILGQLMQICSRYKWKSLLKNKFCSKQFLITSAAKSTRNHLTKARSLVSDGIFWLILWTFYIFGSHLSTIQSVNIFTLGTSASKHFQLLSTRYIKKRIYIHIQRGIRTHDRDVSTLQDDTTRDRQRYHTGQCFGFRFS